MASTRELAAALTRRWIDLVAGLVREAGFRDDRGDGVDSEAVATMLVGSFDGLKMTVDVVSAGDHAAADRMLDDGGRLLERMLFETLGPGPRRGGR